MNGARTDPEKLSTFAPSPDVQVICASKFPDTAVPFLTTGLVWSSNLSSFIETTDRKGTLKEICIHVIPVEWDRLMACVFEAFQKNSDISSLTVNAFGGHIRFNTRIEYANSGMELFYQLIWATILTLLCL